MDNAGVSSSSLFQNGMSMTPEIEHGVESGGPRPFAGLVICITGFSKEARKQVMEVTERLGGIYSPTLHPKCTHLLVQSFRGRKLEHALKHGIKNGLFVVTLGWFVESVRKNVRLCELPYIVYNVADMSSPMEDWLVNPVTTCNSCGHINLKKTMNKSEECKGQKQRDTEEKFEVSKRSDLSGHNIYIDSDVSAEMRSKVVDAVILEGARLIDKWFVGCGASYVVSEASSVQKYIGHGENIVSPVWVLKTSKERSKTRCVGLSADLARQVGLMLESAEHSVTRQERSPHLNLSCEKNRSSQAERLEIVKLAKCGVKNRRTRRLQSCEGFLRPISPSSLLDSICWSISEPPSKATVYDDISKNSVNGDHMFSVDQEGREVEASFTTPVRPLTEIEKNEVVFRNHFLTILFPVDRFAEMGPSSRTYFSENGFSCLQLLDFIYEFYQENMLDHEIEAAIHTDSRYAEQLRSMYCSEGTEDSNSTAYKRVDFLGSRKSFEMLKRVSGENNSNVYELLIRA